jgi:hypothetical protein
MPLFAGGEDGKITAARAGFLRLVRKTTIFGPNVTKPP